MQGFSASALLALLFGIALLPLLFIPYVVWSFRRGTTGLGHAAISAAGVFYLLALWTYTILPLPQASSLTCDTAPQWIPLHFVTDVRAHGAGVLTDPAVRQVVLNVLFFVPFGILARHLLRRRVLWCIVGGLVTSLLIELTQLSGVWGVYPCAYRVFDVDDLIANTLGAVLGVALAPLAARIPGQHVRPAGEPTAVRPVRRLAQMAVDATSVFIVGVGIPLLVRILLYAVGRDPALHTGLVQVVATLSAAVVLLWIVPAATGGTLGHHVTFLRPVRRDARPPLPVQWAVRFVTGAGGWSIAVALADLDVPGMVPLEYGWVVVSAVVVIAMHTRGISGYASGLVLVDARDPDLAAGIQDPGVDPRRMRSAVVATGGLVFLALCVIVALAEISPTVGIGVALVGLAVLLVASFFLVGYLLYNGILVVRREGHSLGNLLSLATVGAICALTVLLVVALLTGWTWLVVIAVAGLALSAYIGFLFGAFLIYGQLYAHAPVTPGFAAVVVLGSRVYGDRVPPLLAARIDRGLELIRSEAARGRSPLLVLSGGQGPDETQPEGQAMAAYAVAHGADPAQVRAETASVNTEQNLALSTRLLTDEGRTGPIVVSTNDFHAFRAALIARELGIPAHVVGAPTARYYFPSAVLREFVGILARARAPYAATALAVMAISGVLAGFAAG